MHKSFSLAAFALLAAGASAAAAAAANVSVTFIQPETYTDAAYSRPFAGEKERDEVQRDIERHLRQLADRSLPPGDALKIEVLDIDLAGRFNPLRSPPGSDLRIVSDADWPRITLRYTLSRDGRVLASAEEKLSDQTFLMSANRYSSSDRLRYEKAMLDDWFSKRIGQ